VPPTVPHQAGPARRPHAQAAFPGAAGGQAAVFTQERASLRRHSVVLAEQREPGIGRIEPAHQHDDERRHDQSIRLGVGTSSWPLSRLRGQGTRSLSTTRLTSQLGWRSIFVPPWCRGVVTDRLRGQPHGGHA
jgi:hypothetical protein